jgi:hypothetical protein
VDEPLGALSPPLSPNAGAPAAADPHQSFKLILIYARFADTQLLRADFACKELRDAVLRVGEPVSNSAVKEREGNVPAAWI